MKRIIVADDDRVTSHLLCTILRKDGYAPEPALDVGALFAACDREPRPLAILLDMNMPGGSGPDSIRRLKASPHLSSVPVIVVSGLIAHEDHFEVMRLGASAFIEKPIDPQHVLETLARAIAPPHTLA